MVSCKSIIIGLIFFVGSHVDLRGAAVATQSFVPTTERRFYRRDKVFCDQILTKAGSIERVFLYIFSAPGQGSNIVQHLNCEENSAAVRYLLAKGASVAVQDSAGFTPLHYFVTKQSRVEVIALLIKAGADVNAKDCCGWPPLHCVVACTNNVEVIRVLIGAGARVNDSIPDCQSTVLHWAARFNRPKVIQELLAHGAEMNVYDAEGQTPLDIARKKGHFDCAAIFEAYQSFLRAAPV